MATLLDKQRSATRKVQSPDEATLDQVLSRITALAPMVARLARDIEQDRRLPAELVSALAAFSILYHPPKNPSISAEVMQFSVAILCHPML